MKPARILIIEDEAITVAALKRELAELGYHVAGTAMNAQEAVLAAEEYTPDLVLMDITLADEFDGVIAATAIRGSLSLPGVLSYRSCRHANNRESDARRPIRLRD